MLVYRTAREVIPASVTGGLSINWMEPTVVVGPKTPTTRQGWTNEDLLVFSLEVWLLYFAKLHCETDSVYICTLLYVLMKLFKCANIDVVNDCRRFSKVELPSEMLEEKSTELIRKFVNRKNSCRYFDICI